MIIASVIAHAAMGALMALIFVLYYINGDSNQFTRLYNFIRLKTSQDVSRPLGTICFGRFFIYTEGEVW